MHKKVLTWTALGAAGLLTVAVAAEPAAAKTVTIGGHVIGQPTAAGKRTSVPVLLAGKGERRLRARTPLVRFLVPRRARVAFPGPNGPATTTPSGVRPGDGVRLRVKLTRRMVRSARRARVPKIKAVKLRVTARASMLSNDELRQLLTQLQAQFTALSQRVDDLSTRQASDIAGLRSEMRLIETSVGSLRVDLVGLQGALSAIEAALEARIAALEDGMDELEASLVALQVQVGDLEEGLGALIVTVTTLQGTVGDLAGQLGDLGGDVALLQVDLDAIFDRLATLDLGLADVMGDVLGLETGLSDLTSQVGTLQASLAAALDGIADLTGDVAGLATELDTLTSIVGQHELDIDALELDLDLVAGNVLALDADVDLLSGDLVDIEAALGLLDTEVDGLQLDVSLLCDLVSPATC